MVETGARPPDLRILKDQLYFILDQTVYENLPRELSRITPIPPDVVVTDLVISIDAISQNNRRVRALKLTVYIDLGLKTTIRYRQEGLLEPRRVLTYDQSPLSQHQHTPKFNTVVNILSRELSKHRLRADYIEVTHHLVRNDATTATTRPSRRPYLMGDTDPATLPDKSTVAFNHTVSIYYIPGRK